MLLFFGPAPNRACFSSDKTSQWLGRYDPASPKQMMKSAADRPVPLEIHYPESDGKPMAESEIHGEALIYLREALQVFYRDDDQVYVGSNMFFYYEEGNPNKCVAPDVFVVRGVPKRPPRRIYKLWQEGMAPVVVFEITSANRRSEDLGHKKILYESLEVEVERLRAKLDRLGQASD